MSNYLYQGSDITTTFEERTIGTYTANNGTPTEFPAMSQYASFPTGYGYGYGGIDKGYFKNGVNLNTLISAKGYRPRPTTRSETSNIGYVDVVSHVNGFSYTINGSFTYYVNVGIQIQAVLIMVVGGGGSGANALGGTTGGGGGGGCGLGWSFLPFRYYTGAGGIHPTAWPSNGVDGSPSYVVYSGSTVLSATGGQGGRSSTGGVGGSASGSNLIRSITGGAGGVSTSGDGQSVSAVSQACAPEFNLATPGGLGGVGYWSGGGGASAIVPGAPGSSGDGYLGIAGGAGGGGSTAVSGTADGGNGGGGLVRMYY